MHILMQVLGGILVIGGFVMTPILLIWGWTCWIRSGEKRDRSILLSFAGFLFVTASALVATSAVAYASWIRGFAYYDPRLLKIYAGGLVLSLVGVMLSALGAARPNVLRWQALGSSIGMLLFWFVAMVGE